MIRVAWTRRLLLNAFRAATGVVYCGRIAAGAATDLPSLSRASWT
jgi:hypothetical protein